jgi:ribosomal-protein-alanine N-acetyltransferase
MNMDPVFTSKRLFFREFTPEDWELIYELNSDPEVVKYLHEPQTTPEVAKDVLANTIIPQYRKYNHGRWALFTIEANEFIGWCGLKYRAEAGIVDLGYRFKKKFWGFGYATEAAIRSVEYGFEVLQLPKLFGAAHVDNIASQKVLEKAGLHFVGTSIIDNCLTKTYEIERSSKMVD